MLLHACQSAPKEFEGVQMHVEGEPQYLCDVEGTLLRSADGDLHVPNNIVIKPAKDGTPSRA
eukprot:1609175-Prymnesium_polylepis.1